MKLLNSKDPSVFRTWGQCLVNLSDIELRKGLELAADLDPNEFFDIRRFKSLCKINPKNLGLPSEEQAYHEASSNCHNTRGHKWTHPAVYRALELTGLFFMRNEPRGKSEKVYLRHYEVVTRMVMNGENLNVNIPLALPSSGEVLYTEEENHESAANILKMFKK